MSKRFWVNVALATVLSMPALAQTPKEEGWIYIAKGAGGLTVYGKPAPGGTGTHPRLWVRYEEALAAKSRFRSAVALYEFDCKEGQFTVLTYTGYTEPNMAGESQSFPRTAPDFYAPGTVNETLSRRVCPAS